MGLMSVFLDYMLHLDKHLALLTAEYGVWTYVILFLVVFAETGLVVTPFLPGDSLLFAAGAVCALGSMDVGLLMALLAVAAIAGDSVNYAIGSTLGHRILSKGSRFVKQEHIDRTHAFYEKHGGKMIVFARFIPIVRTFAPFVAGIGSMQYRSFALYNVLGGIAWVVSFSLLGYFFGGLPFVKQNFTFVVVAIVVISVLPAVIEAIKARRATA